jgi:hypothetical protein
MLALCGVHSSQLEMAVAGMSKGWISQPVLFLVLTKVLRLLASDLFFKNIMGSVWQVLEKTVTGCQRCTES